MTTYTSIHNIPLYDCLIEATVMATYEYHTPLAATAIDPACGGIEFSSVIIEIDDRQIPISWSLAEGDPWFVSMVENINAAHAANVDPFDDDQ